MDLTSIPSPPLPQDSNPNYLRLQSLSHKWSTLQLSLSHQKLQRQSHLHDKLTSLQLQLTDNLYLQETAITNLQNNVQKLEKVLLEERQQKTMYQNNKRKELEELEQEVLERVEIQKKTIENTTSELIQQADKRILSNLQKLQSFNTQKDTAIQSLLLTTRQKLNFLQTKIVQDRKRREEQTTHVTQMIENQLNILHNMLGVQKKVREQTQGKIWRMVEQVHGRLREEMEKERKGREEMEGALGGLLEETGRRMEMSFR